MDLRTASSVKSYIYGDRQTRALMSNENNVTFSTEACSNNVDKNRNKYNLLSPGLQ